MRALFRSPQRPELLAAPGNAGIEHDRVPCHPVAADDVPGIVALAQGERCDFVVVGPEAPLVAGLVDALAAVGIRAFGPSAEGARIEGSKAYAKELMRAVGIPTASHTVFRDREEALAAGKGVIICQTEAEAREAVDEFFVDRRFGDTTVVLEEFLEGEELSLLALCDGVTAVPMAPAQDYKRIFDGDRGPNTGGMGSYSPVPGIGREHAEVLARTVHQPIVDELRRRGTPFHGVLYAGLMMTAEGPRVLEYNCRFGDPETQAVLPRLRSDLLELLDAASRFGGLEGVELEWSPTWAVTVVLASRGYPESSSSGDEITGLRNIDSLEVEVLHAGTAEEDGKIVTAPMPVTLSTRPPAERVEFEGKQMRHDIAARAVDRVEA